MNIFTKKIAPAKQEEIKDFILNNFDANISQKDYAFWQIKSTEFTAIFYNSSKFVVQGKNINALLDALAPKYKEFEVDSTESTKTKANGFSELAEQIQMSTHIGTDESGKGDFFGPLVIAGVQVNDKNRQLFLDLGIKDSKTLKDSDMLKMAVTIKNNSAFSVIAISNQKYNELYKKFKNLNKLLAWGHGKVIENILEKSPCEIALSDQFGDERLIQNALQTKGQNIKLYQRTKAESDIAVAAASVLARATFVIKMQEMEKTYNCKFPKGANNIVKSCANEFIKMHGKEKLSEVCKAHFKTYNEV